MNLKSVCIKIRRYSKSYNSLHVFNNLNVDIYEKEILGILGPNGCGKSTLLNSIAGLEDFKGIIEKSSENIGFVGQKVSELIMPWMTVSENISFPNNPKGIDKKKLSNLLKITHLDNYAKRYPYELSGGMLQLLLIARAIFNESRIIVLDEPFKSLDFEMAEKMQIQILKLWSLYKPTIIFVSHDIDEAIFMANRILILSKKPTRIKRIINIDMPKDRRKLLTSKKFLDIKKEVLNAFSN